MEMDRVTVPHRVERIVKRESLGCPPRLIDLHLSVQSYHPKAKDKKMQYSAVYPSTCITANHTVPTQQGWRKAEDLKVGDVLLLELPLMVG